MSNILRAMSDGPLYNMIVQSYLSDDGGSPIGGHAKVASQTEDVCCSCVLYIPHVNIY